MKITNEPTYVYFKDLQNGDVFNIPTLGVYMKVATKGNCNAIHMESGEFASCHECCKVELLDCELIIH